MCARPTAPTDVLKSLSIELRLNDRVSFFDFDNRKAIFSEPLQKLFELNDTSCFLASSIVDSPAMPQLVQQLQRLGFTFSHSLNTIEQFAVAWSRLRLLSVFISRNSLKPIKTNTISLAGKNVELHFYDSALVDTVLPVFAHLSTQGRQVIERINIMAAGGLSYIFQDGNAALLQALDQTAPALKGLLTDLLFAREGSNLGLHCAMLVRGDHALLLAGPPGAGKTTLAMNLIARGFDYAADDITLLMSDGQARGVSFAPGIKPGAWKLLNYPEYQLDGSPIHRRIDGRKVKYLSNMRLARNGPVRVKWIAILRRNANGSQEWKTASITSVLKELIRGAHASDQHLSEAQLRLLISVITQATTGMLEYSDASNAARLLEEVCEG